MSAAIVGSGIAGLATAAALKRENVPVVVYERAPEICELGAGLALWTNGVNALEQLGVKDRVMAVSSVVNQVVTMSDDGKVLDRIELGDIGRQHGAECVCVHRGDLQRILMEAAGAERIHTGANCVGVQQDQKHATVCLNDGSRTEADFVVAADGIRSMIRNQLHPRSQLRFAGYSAWRALVPGTFSRGPEGATLVMLGLGSQAGIFQCGPHRVYWFATQNAPANPKLSPEVRKIALLKNFVRWPAPLAEVIETTPAENILENDIFDLRPLKNWGLGRVTFAGDAIHPMTPDLGQGAALALEDAVVLSRCVRNGTGIEKALREYERSRRARTAWIAIASRRLGLLLQTENTLAVLARRWFLSTHFAHRQGERFLKQLLESR